MQGTASAQVASIITLDAMHRKEYYDKRVIEIILAFLDANIPFTGMPYGSGYIFDSGRD